MSDRLWQQACNKRFIRDVRNVLCDFKAGEASAEDAISAIEESYLNQVGDLEPNED